MKCIDGWTINQSGSLLECISGFTKTYINLTRVQEIDSTHYGIWTDIRFCVIKRDGNPGQVLVRVHREYSDEFIDDIKSRIESLGFITEES